MEQEKQGNEPAYPHVKKEQYDDGMEFEEITPGLTTRQHAAIQLRIPDSGEDWLDDMIRRARRMDMIQTAIPGRLAYGDAAECYSHASIPRTAAEIADAFLKLESENQAGV